MEDRNVCCFTPLLEQFCTEVKQNFSGQYAYTHGLMFPHLLSEEYYQKASRRFFYLGQDTRWWMEKESELGSNAFSKMLEMGCSGKAADYLKLNNRWPGNDINQIFEWGNRITFWPAVIKLQIYLQTNKECSLKNIWDCSEENKEYLKGMGYGNIYSVERASSLKSEGYGAIPELNILHEKSAVIDKLRHILRLYSPDFIIVFCWNWSEKHYFDDIKIKHRELIDKWCIYEFEGYKTKMICTRHPRCFNRIDWGYPGFDEMIKRTGDLILDRL